VPEEQPSAPMTYVELDAIASEQRRAQTQGRKSGPQMVANVQSALRRWIKDLNLSASSLVGTELGSEFTTTLASPHIVRCVSFWRTCGTISNT